MQISIDRPPLLPPVDYSRLQEQNKKSEVRLIFGKRGYGKSLLTKTEILNDHARVIIIDPLKEYESYFSNHFYNVVDLYRYISYNKVYRVSCSDTSKAETIANLVYHLGNIHLVMEEAQIFLPDSSEDLGPVWENIILRGRHKKVEFTVLAQRPTLINIKLRSQHTELNTFFQNEPNDLKWIKQVSGLEPEQIMSLKKGEYYQIKSGDPVKKNLTKIKL